MKPKTKPAPRRVTSVMLDERTFQTLREVQADIVRAGERPSVSAAIRSLARAEAKRRGLPESDLPPAA